MRAGERGIACLGYCLQVPANRPGQAVYSAPQLKELQEIITLLVVAALLIFREQGPQGACRIKRESCR